MKKTRLIPLMIIVPLTLLINCSIDLIDYDNSAQDLQIIAEAKGKIIYVPYKESGTLSPTSDLDADLSVECNDELFEIFNIKSGRASHMGKITGFENSCVNFATGEVTVTGVNIAANGDRLYFEALCGFMSPTDFTCQLNINGGTGRFENASNPPNEPIIVEGTFDSTTGVSYYNSYGKISTVGSSN